MNHPVRIALVLVGTLVAGCSHATPSPGARLTAPPVASHRVVRGFAHPESVEGAGDRYYVSSIGASLAPLAKDGDGFISELDAEGTVRVLRAFAPLDAPKGLAASGNVLFVADIDRVVAFDRASHARLFEVVSPHPPPTLLNDLAVENDDALLVTDTLAGSVYRLRVSLRSMIEIAHDLPGANGIAIDGAAGVAYVVGIGADFSGGDLFALPLAGGAPRRLGNAHGRFDGIALTDDGGLIVTDWVGLPEPVPGIVARYATDGTPHRMLALPEPMHGPADVHYDRVHHQLWIPRTLDDSVSIVEMR